MPATAKRLASWRVLKEMLQSFLRRCSLLDVLESLTVGTCVQHFFQVLSRGGGSLAQVFACPGHNFFFPCPILRFACPVFVDKCITGFIHILENTLPDIQAFGFVSAEEAGVFAAGTRVDIAFLDIELCDESGIDLAKELSALNPHTNIVFLTGHSEYAGDALSMHVSGYILKPLTPDKVREEIRHLRYPVKGLS